MVGSIDGQKKGDAPDPGVARGREGPGWPAGCTLRACLPCCLFSDAPCIRRAQHASMHPRRSPGSVLGRGRSRQRTLAWAMGHGRQAMGEEESRGEGRRAGGKEARRHAAALTATCRATHSSLSHQASSTLSLHPPTLSPSPNSLAHSPSSFFLPSTLISSSAPALLTVVYPHPQYPVSI